jgi:hypothetical protein
MCSGLLPPGIGLAGADAGAASPNSVQGTISDPLAATASKDKKWTKAPWILIAAFALFALLGGSGWSLLNDSQDRDLAPNQENSQELDSAPAPENEATKASEEAEPAPSVEVAPAKEPVQARAPSTAPPEGAGLEQTPPSNAAVEFSTFTPALVNNPVNTGPQLPLQPAAPQQAHPVQVASDEQDQVQILSSQTSYDGESEARQISGAEGGQTIKQVFESSKPSDD